MSSENPRWCTQNAENGLGFDFEFFYSDTTNMAMNFTLNIV
jgi:hypothetical protein